MTDTTLEFHAAHRGPRRAAGASLAQRLWRALDAFARLRTAKAHEQVSRHAREAADVRALALRHAASDRGFAADLYAAADRHEAAGGEALQGLHPLR
jgi:hypothetical protein